MKNKFILLCSLLFFSFSLQAQVIYSDSNYIEYHPGTVPIVISAPHGGLINPSHIPDRTCNNPTLVTDGKTKELALAIDSMFYLKTGCHIHLVICNLKRTKLDCNRNVADAACGNPVAESAWNSFHHFIDSAQGIASSNFAHHFYIDLHAHGHTKQRLELGYLLWGSRLRNSDSTLNTQQFIDYSSIQDLVVTNTNNYTHAELLRGPYALGTLLANAGYPSVPSAQDIHPDTTDAFFSGGYNTVTHTCYNPTESAIGVQIETNYTGIRDNATNRAKFGDSLSSVLINYLNHHLNMNLGYCAPASTKNLRSSKFKVYPSILSAGEQLFFSETISGASYNIYDMTGKKIQAGLLDNYIGLSHNISPATYILQINFKGQNSSYKIIVR